MSFDDRVTGACTDCIFILIFVVDMLSASAGLLFGSTVWPLL